MTSTLSPPHDALLETVPPGATHVATRDVDYSADGTALQGYLAFDESTDQARPGVLVVHDWNGIGEYVQVRAQMLARLGYIAFAPDIYGRGIRPDDSDAAQIAGTYYGNPGLMRSRILAGLDQLQAQPQVDSTRIAAIGYCFGGSVSLALAASGADLLGVVSFHGALVPVSPEDAAGIRAKILVLGGAADPVVPDEAVRSFENSLRAAPHVDWQHARYSGAMHAFTLPEANAPDHGAQYNAAAEKRSWTAMLNFFEEIFSS